MITHAHNDGDSDDERQRIMIHIYVEGINEKVSETVHTILESFVP